MVDAELEDIFPGLRGQPFQIHSPKDHRYNCIAFVAGDIGHWWWPDAAGEDAWPDGIARVETIAAFHDAFASLGYVVCENDQLELGYDKIALFAVEGAPKHASRQLPSGRWVSKLGMSEDIEHALNDLSGQTYGTVVLLMKRPLSR